MKFHLIKYCIKITKPLTQSRLKRATNTKAANCERLVLTENSRKQFY